MSVDGRLRISKLDAARRQLDCAIELWAADKDPVSVHTLACAAHQIVYDISAKRGGDHPLFDSDQIADEHRREFRRLLRKDMTFFKHAERDAEAITEFAPLSSVVYMMVAIGLCSTSAKRRQNCSAFTSLGLFSTSRLG